MQLKNWHWLYWGTASLMLAVIVHLAIVLFLPVVKTARQISTIEITGDIAQLAQIAFSDHQSAPIVSFRNPDISYAFCRFDLSERPLKISARFPRTFWSIGVYSDTGDNVYSLNDRQAGIHEIELILVDGSRGDEDAAEAVTTAENTIVVSSLARTGIVIFRALIAERSEAQNVAQRLAASSCEMS